MTPKTRLDVILEEEEEDIPQLVRGCCSCTESECCSYCQSKMKSFLEGTVGTLFDVRENDIENVITNNGLF